MYQALTYVMDQLFPITNPPMSDGLHELQQVYGDLRSSGMSVNEIMGHLATFESQYEKLGCFNAENQSSDNTTDNSLIQTQSGDEPLNNFFDNPDFQQQLKETGAKAVEHGKKVDAWRNALPREWREGDMFFLVLDGIDPVCDGWILAKRHTDDPKLWFALPVDDWESMVGSMDTVVTGKHFGTHVCRTLCGAWIHEDDMSFDNRWDAVEGDTGAPKSKLKYFVEGLLSHREDTDHDPDYEEWIDKLHGYTHQVTERLHFGEEGDEE